MTMDGRGWEEVEPPPSAWGQAEDSEIPEEIEKKVAAKKKLYLSDILV
jgi:hypothetical protein